ncbi:MAG: metallophosphoesterase [Acidobacteria bacterium]|nr:metallophosphoesterase [Acidobacteriota bacterium]
MLRREWLTMAGAAWAGGAVKMGLVADVQYADQPQAGARAYRESLQKLRICAEWFNGRKLDFAIQMGDLTDGGAENLARAAAGWLAVRTRRYDVIGNHDAGMAREAMLQGLGLKSGWYSFAAGGWRMVVLDCSDASVMAAALHREEGTALLRAAQKNAFEWNGGLSREQMGWFRDTLADAKKRRQRALVFCHQPLIAAACRPEHLLLNHAEVVGAMEESGVVAACFAGHDHKGGFAAQKGIQYLTLQGLVENKPEDCAAVAELGPEIIVRWMGGRELRLARGA